MDWALLVGIASVLFIFMYGLFRVLSGARGSVSESNEAKENQNVGQGFKTTKEVHALTA